MRNMKPTFDRQRGFTMIEMMVAVTIVSALVIGLAGFVPRFMNTASKGAIISAASDLAVDRVETIKAYPTYAPLETTFNATEVSFPTCGSCTRTTTIVHDSAATFDYKVVTVQVTTPLLPATVSKTTVIPAF
jgi:prepilin-type N-terminal cleavage/methylation domain-containing protein